MFYIIRETDGKILGVSSVEPDVQHAADEMGCAVWVLQGEHTGLSASPHRIAYEPLNQPITDPRDPDY